MIGALARLIASRDSDMIKWCTRTAQSQLKLVVERVGNMQKGVGPRIHTLTSSEFLKKIGEAIQWLMSFTVHHMGRAKVLRGASAPRIKFEHVREMIVAERILAILQEFHLLRSMLSQGHVDDASCAHGEIGEANLGQALVARCRRGHRPRQLSNRCPERASC